MLRLCKQQGAVLLWNGGPARLQNGKLWLPTYLKTERNLSVFNTSGYLLVLILGSFVGYLTSAWLSDKLGRRRCFMLFALCAGLLVIAYT